MSTTLILGAELTAADVPNRTLRYRLLPYGEVGATSLGLVEVDAGAIRLPASPGDVVLNIEHDRRRPVGRGVLIEDTPEALYATFNIAPTSTGNDLLAEADAGLRTGGSVELRDAVIRAGHVVGALLGGAGAVVSPAFASATLTAAADTVDNPDEATTVVVVDATLTEGNPAMTTETLTATTLETAALTASTPARTAPRLTFAGAASLAARAVRGEIGAVELEAALSDIPHTGNEAAMPPQWLGEVWDGITYRRDIVDAISSGPLTSASLAGWKWQPRPKGAAYTGDKTAVPSPAAGIDPVSQGIHRWAGGHDFDRIFVDLGDASIMESYFREMNNDYAEYSNAVTTADLLVAAGVPLEIADPLELVVAVATAIKGGPTFIAVSADVAAGLILTNATLPFLVGSLLLSGDGTIGGSGIFIGQELPAATVLAGRREAATFLEPGGASPIRVRAVDLVKGGEDAAAFGYCASLTRNPAAFKAGTTVVTP